MNKTFLAVWFAIAMFSMTSTVFARIGDTLEQCKKRYGAPIVSSEKNQSFDFKHEGVKINIRVHEGKVVAISYTSPDKGGFTVDQIMSRLVANNGKGDWNLPQGDDVGRMTWTHEDASRGATIDKERLLLKVYTIDDKGNPVSEGSSSN